MSETPPATPTDDIPPQPFARGRIQWSRPPQATFRVGPLPAGPSRSRFISSGQRPARPAGGGILSGSMIPSARAAEPSPFNDAILTEAASQPVEETVVDIEETVTPIEPQSEFEPKSAAEARQEPMPAEVIVEIEDAEPVVTVPPPLSDEAASPIDPRSVPSVVVTRAIYATVGATLEKVTKKDRWLVIAGVVAIAVIGGFIWVATLPSGASSVSLDPEAPSPAAYAPIEAAIPENTSVAAEVGPAQATTAEAPARSAPHVTPPAIRPARIAPPQTDIATVQSAPRPYVETAPLDEPEPTPAAPPPSDPSAPIQTQPQPLNQAQRSAAR